NIANKHSITLGELKSWNSLSTHMIYPGQKLIVSKQTNQPKPDKPAQEPSPVTGSASYTVRSGDTLSGIALKHQTTVIEIKRLNGLKSD
ncbi:LysM peptidoglycan-binding domain-containing protein, partial [Leucobacter sp. M11]|uniref:LysM peptidoglycan-binding domain-containing protein n=1 Tax=Leucobacter sp. M11 TaxID=2993565 RepID=UPI002D7F4303